MHDCCKIESFRTEYKMSIKSISYESKAQRTE